MQSEKNKTLEAEIARLDDLGLDELRELCGTFWVTRCLTMARLCCADGLPTSCRPGCTAICQSECEHRLKRLHKAFKADPSLHACARPRRKARHRADPDLARRNAPGAGNGSGLRVSGRAVRVPVGGGPTHHRHPLVGPSVFRPARGERRPINDRRRSDAAPSIPASLRRRGWTRPSTPSMPSGRPARPI